MDERDLLLDKLEYSIAAGVKLLNSSLPCGYLFYAAARVARYVVERRYVGLYDWQINSVQGALLPTKRIKRVRSLIGKLLTQALTPRSLQLGISNPAEPKLHFLF